MKILIYSHLFPPAYGGMGFSNLQIAKGLLSLNHDIEVVACHNEGAREFIATLSFPVTLLPKWPFATMQSLKRKGLYNWTFAPWYYLIIKRRIKEFKPDVIFVTDETANAVWGLWAKHVAVPYISYCSVPHLTLGNEKQKLNIQRKLKHNLNKRIERQIKQWMLNSYLHAEFILAVSNSTKSQLCMLSSISQKIRVVPRSIDDIFFDTGAEPNSMSVLRHSLGISDDHFVLLSVANIGIVKGISDVIEALNDLRQYLPKIKYIVVGQGSALPYLKQLSQTLKLRENVIFAGAIPHLQLLAYYDICDLFILPSRKGPGESFGRVFVEAAARSKPSIGVNQGGMVDIIKDGETGFLVSPGDVSGIRDKIEDLILNTDKVKELGEKARQRVEKRYRSKTIAYELYEYLKKAAMTSKDRIK